MNDIKVYRAMGILCVCLLAVILIISTDMPIFQIILLEFACYVCYLLAGDIMENSLKEIEELKKQMEQLKNKKE